MADERTTPTPRAGVVDTMHSTPASTDAGENPMNPYEGKDIPAGASKPPGELVEQVSGGGEPATVPALADHHDIAYRDRDPGVVNDGLGSVGSDRPGKRVIPSKDDAAGTLVEDIPDMRELNPAQSTAVNTPNPAPENVARQPGESDEAYAERTKSSRTASAKPSTRKASTRKASTKAKTPAKDT